MLATSRVDPSVRVRPASVPCERQDRLAESSLQQRLPAQSQPVLRPPSRLPATGGRALPGWGGGPSRCDGPRGAAAAAGWAVRPGSLSRAPRRCNRTPSARPRRPATCHSLRGAELSDVEEKGSGCRGSPARDSSTKKLSIRQQETSPRDS